MTPPDPPPDAPLSRLVGRRPTKGAAVAAKDVLGDVQTLVKAEVALAKAEVMDGVKSTAMGAGLFIGVAVVGWLFIQAFLVFLGFVFATFLPGWAASGLVVLLLLIIMGVLGYLGYVKFQNTPSLETTKETVAESRAAAQTAVDQAKSNARAGADEAKATVTETAQQVAADVKARAGRGGPSTVPAPDVPADTKNEMEGAR